MYCTSVIFACGFDWMCACKLLNKAMYIFVCLRVCAQISERAYAHLKMNLCSQCVHKCVFLCYKAGTTAMFVMMQSAIHPIRKCFTIRIACKWLKKLWFWQEWCHRKKNKWLRRQFAVSIWVINVALCKKIFSWGRKYTVRCLFYTISINLILITLNGDCEEVKNDYIVSCNRLKERFLGKCTWNGMNPVLKFNKPQEDDCSHFKN